MENEKSNYKKLNFEYATASILKLSIIHYPLIISVESLRF